MRAVGEQWSSYHARLLASAPSFLVLACLTCGQSRLGRRGLLLNERGLNPLLRVLLSCDEQRGSSAQCQQSQHGQQKHGRALHGWRMGGERISGRARSECHSERHSVGTEKKVVLGRGTDELVSLREYSHIFHAETVLVWASRIRVGTRNNGSTPTPTSCELLSISAEGLAKVPRCFESMNDGVDGITVSLAVFLDQQRTL